MKRILCCSLLLAAGLTITSCQMNKKNADASTTEVTAVQPCNREFIPRGSFGEFANKHEELLDCP